jgi:hypothetical protein
MEVQHDLSQAAQIVDRESAPAPAVHQTGGRRFGRGGSITGGVFLIGLGMLLLTNWWWPGIMLVIGAAIAAEMARRGEIGRALVTFAIFAAIPFVSSVTNAIDIPWVPTIAFVLIALGLLSLGRNVVQ